jgi:hypothetical protein
VLRAGKDRHMSVAGWLALLRDSNLFDEGEGVVGAVQARQLFMMSRMYTAQVRERIARKCDNREGVRV